ncbi:SpoVR family protein, partial [Klebsiella pneumoniae]|uniref:SpoVR family protein n=1 Tax=Klebsiella pneumoniae TaxID=573 RepID=UPI001E443E86
PAGFAEEYIIESIWNNRFPPGSILPAERELSELIGVTRTTLRIVRKVSQYFYPQKQTQVMNEGWATFWHYTILNHLYDEGKV